MRTRILPTRNLNTYKHFFVVNFTLLFCIFSAMNLKAQCPQDIQPFCPIITGAIMAVTPNSDGTTSNVEITINYEQGTANNASLQWDVYYGDAICPEDYDTQNLYPSENCQPVNSSNSSGFILDFLFNVPLGESVYLVAQGRTNGSCGGNTCNQFFLQVTQAPVVPVKLSKFEGKIVDNHVLLEWATESEIQNEGFIIEKSINSKDFQDIEFIQGNGTTNTLNTYNYLDKTSISSLSYYRLKQMDYDGKFTYSDIIQIESRSSDKNLAFSIFPNPVKNDEFTIQTTDYLNATIEVTDDLGNRMFFSSVDQDQFTISTSNWPIGMYNVLLLKNDNYQVQRIIKID